ncbi:DUF3775 domain-containing protein [Thiohalomonas denitrificans]|uniref:DUF3775 domain-containing protein n=1 Tax=Thiohalomonas denitrificans TaxID=415747 RepID=A0A1G5QR55_9GAMM|nr:DUF3775 domain-containing protein [Thiohalomonas denitrificans]SCZ64237.1 Protein of unknown function [Thiohalomonas denitrificans]
MIELNPDIVRAVIERAREFQAQDSVVFPDEQTIPSDDAEWAMQVVAGHDEDTVLEEGRTLIDDLEPDQQVTLMALMWVGRGDFAPEEWEEALEQGRDLYADNTADILFSTPMVSDYLEEGLAALGYQE